MSARQNTITVTLGRKGSGKSHYVRRRWTDHEPRLITLDYTGEARELDPTAIVVHDAMGAADTFARLLRADVSEWHVVAQMRPGDVEELYNLLVPEIPTRPSAAKAFGGVAITCDEMSFVAPMQGTPDSVRNALMIGRHYGLSQHYATQRPQNISGAVKGQADYVTSFLMFERHEVNWIRDSVGGAVADMVPELAQYEHIEYESTSGVVTLRDGRDRVKLSRHLRDLTREVSRNVSPARRA